MTGEGAGGEGGNGTPAMHLPESAHEVYQTSPSHVLRRVFAPVPVRGVERRPLGGVWPVGLEKKGWAALVKLARLKAGINQRELAVRLGVTQQRIDRIETDLDLSLEMAVRAIEKCGLLVCMVDPRELGE